MGSILDRSKEIRKEQAHSPRQAYDSQKKLAPCENGGIKMAPTQEGPSSLHVHRLYGDISQLLRTYKGPVDISAVALGLGIQEENPMYAHLPRALSMYMHNQG